MLSLNGGTSAESPVMGAISDLDPNNAYTIMSYMSIKVPYAQHWGRLRGSGPGLCACLNNPDRHLALCARMMCRPVMPVQSHLDATQAP